MTGTSHAVTGAVIALTVKYPLLAVPLSFLSHYLQDLVPHFNFFSGPGKEHLFKRRFNITLIVDFLAAVTLMVVLANWFPSEKWLIWSCMVAAAIPDLPKAYSRLYGEKIKKRSLKQGRLERFHSKLQLSETPAGLITEIIWITVGLVIISNLR